MNASLTKRIEIKFWDFTIQTLSENQQVRGMIRDASRAVHSGELKRTVRILAASAAAGLLSGFLLCVFFTLR